MSKLIPTYIEQSLRIEVLERAVIASESDVEQLERELAEAKEQLRLCNVDQFTTAAELAETRNDALKKAAQVCDSESSCEGIAQKCAAAIRAMKEGGK